MCALKMADGVCTGETLSNVIENTAVGRSDDCVQSVKTDSVHVAGVGAVDNYYNNSASAKLFGDLCANVKGRSTQHEDILDINMPSSPGDEDCRKKRCVDRYDSSESSDSGVAILSCTDSSGSSTASSDITDPGSPFSTASSHSEDSGSQPAKMPPTQNAHHPPWLWTDEQPSLKRTTTPTQNKSAFNKRVKTDELAPKCLNNNLTSSKNAQIDHNPSLKQKQKIAIDASPKLQQGKITEYFKSQYKSSTIMKKELSNIIIKSNNANKYINLVESNKKIIRAPQGKVPIERFPKTRSVPRKILPAPSKPEKLINTINPVSTINTFPPIITTLIPNVAYIQAKAPKPPDNIYVINDNIPIVNRAPCINVLQNLQKITTINNFNCVKYNTGAMVPIVKLNMPSKNYSGGFNVINTAVPTVLPATPKVEMSNITTTLPEEVISMSINECSVEEMSPSDSGVSSGSSGGLEVNVDDDVIGNLEEQQKSPILSQPKTIRFPAKERTVEKQKIVVNNDTATCQWDQCPAQFVTNGALLEHLQVKHVISQASQEQYVCLWQGCKVHGRKSCSRSWLERHVLAHAGSKPFRCIVDGCGQRFNSQLALEKHVNGHFNTDSSQSSSTKKSVENGSLKLFRRNGKKIRFRRQPWSARMFDFMDSGIMEGLQYKLLSMTEKRTLGQFEYTEGDTITLQSQILAKRVEQDGTSKVLLRWHPTDIVDDEWVTEKDYKSTKNVSIPKLEPSAKSNLNPVLFPPVNGQRARQKHKRKPCKNT